MTRRTQQMNEDVLEPRLDLVPGQGIIAEIGDCSLERRAIAAGDMDRSPKNRSRFDPGHLPQPARGFVDCLSGGLIGNKPGIARHLIGGTLRDDMAIRKIDDTLTPFGLVHVVGRDEGGQTFARHVVNEIPELAPGFGIDTGSGLVEQQQLWLVQNTGGERQPLLPAAPKGARRAGPSARRDPSALSRSAPPAGGHASDRRGRRNRDFRTLLDPRRG